MKKSEIVSKIISDISKEMSDIGIRETDTEFIEYMAREIKVIIDDLDYAKI